MILGDTGGTIDFTKVEERRRADDLLLSQLENERSSWMTQWRDLADFILPYRPKFNLSDSNRGDRRNLSIIDSTATFSARTLASGMMSGITSPTRPWFRLTTSDPSLKDNDSVKDWLSDVENRLRELFVSTNLYDSLAMIYSDLGVFGTSAMAILQDDEKTFRCQVFPVGSYMLANNSKGIVDTFARKYNMTCRQLVERFGKKNCSSDVRQQVESGQGEAWREVVHIVRPNPLYDPEKLDARYKRFSSCYYENTGKSKYGDRDYPPYLSESGFDGFPVVAPRWFTSSTEDVYGISPAMEVIGDVKALQVLQKRKAQAIEKQVNPPMVAPASMRNAKASLLPGDITFVEGAGGTDAFRPAFQVNFDTRSVEGSIMEHQQRIRRGMYEDLFLMLATTGQRQPATAEEIRAKQEEKMLILGPVLEKLDNELLNNLIDRVLDIMWERNALPPPPMVLQHQTLKIEYVSVLAQAQRMSGIASIERLMGFVGNISGARPEALDNIDTDSTIDLYADMLGVSPRVTVAKDEVMALRKKRAEAMAQQQAQQQAAQTAQTAQVLSQTDTSRQSALTDLVRQQTGISP
jgi:hypothetical protein